MTVAPMIPTASSRASPSKLGENAQSGELAQELGVAVGDADEAPAVAEGECVECDGLGLDDRAVGSGDRVAVRVVGRFAELGGDALLEAFRENVLEHLRLCVHPVSGDVKLFNRQV